MSSYDSGQNERTEHSPDDARSSKRRRIALACLDCRRRKLKCDRVFPACTRCQKGGHAASCTYDPDAVETFAAPASAERPRGSGHLLNGHRDPEIPGASKTVASPTSFVHHHALDTDDSAVTGLRQHIYRLENRIIGLEKVTHGPQQHYGSNRVGDAVRRPKRHASNAPGQEDEELMMFRGKSFKTQFYGASHHTSYLSHLPKLRMFMKEMVVQHPGLAHVQNELKGQKIKASERANVDKDGKSLAQLLPRKDVVDQLVHIYVENFESTYRVLHLPSFFDEYYQCLDAPDRARPAFVALLLVMMATTACMKPGDQSMLRGDSSLERETANTWLDACDAWLKLQSQKHVSPIIFQIHVVSFLAQQINSIKRKRTWTAAGNLSRIAISAGLHRDAETVNLRHGNLVNRRVTLFDQELRRRIWTTIAELELETALDRGMPAMMRDLIIDCRPPLNIDDEGITKAMDQAVVSKPTSEWTRSSFQHISYNTFALRQELVSLINGPAPNMAYEEVLQYDRKIMQAVDDIPPWQNQSQGAHVSRALLQLQLQHLLLLLHRPYVLHDAQDSRYHYSAVVHLKSAVSILDLHQSLVSMGNPALCVLRSDVLGAVLSICYNFSISGPDVDRNLSTWNSIVGLTDLLPYLENGLSMLDSKISRLGVGIQEFYCICAVIGLQRKHVSSGPAMPTYEFQAADRVSKMIQRMLSLQDNFSAAATLASLPNMPVTAVSGMNGINAMSGQPGVVNGMAPPAQMDNTGLLEDFGHDLTGFDVSGWDLDTFFNF